MRTCKAPDCKERHTGKGWVVWCSPPCGLRIALARLEKKRQAQARAEKKKVRVEKAQDRAKREKMKSRGQWIREAQAQVNRYCRLRDYSRGWGCVTCGTPLRTPGPNADAGHWLGRGAYPEKRFNIFNISLQCVHDNQHLGGLPLRFEATLIGRYGEEMVEKVKAHQPAQKWTIDYIKRLKAVFTKKASRQAKRISNRGDAA